MVGVQGHAVGGGLGLALTGDVVIAGESAKCIPGFVRLAVVRDVGTMYHLPRLTSPSRKNCGHVSSAVPSMSIRPGASSTLPIGRTGTSTIKAVPSDGAGRLKLVRKYDVETADGQLQCWMGIVGLARD